MDPATQTILSMDNITLASHTDAALDLMGIDNPDGFMRECLKYSTNCQSCINAPTSQPCGWCPFSQVCVPDPGHLGILAAIRDKNICPFLSERYEFRARELGCSVSSVTLWSSVISFVVGMLVVMILAAVTTWFARRRVLSWIATVLQNERDKNEASQETSLLMMTGNEDSGYQSTVTSTNSISEECYTYADDESQAEKASDSYVYDPQMMPCNHERPRLHPSPQLGGYTNMSKRDRVPANESNSHDIGRGLLSTFSENLKGLYHNYTG
ncbi:hypothetical protein V1525DRAFT_410309 [Lipomyces kononenkoae]|uniref:Uncharacterized protein n=1 Tax=Lipomyces kononenkoae TaxID=34357 RepID=A0ACC3SV94_LIPKO